MYSDPKGSSTGRALAVCIACTYILALGIDAAAQELTPRSYWPAPKGTRVGTLGLAYTDGDQVPDPSLPITGLDSSISTFVVGYLHTIELFGRSANIVFEAPFSDGTTSAEASATSRPPCRST